MSERTGGVTRRAFVLAAGAAAAGSVLPKELTGEAVPAPPRGMVLLFQGDSITDCGRNRSVPEANQAAALGTGYPLLIAADLLRANPRAGLAIYNRGISGNTVPDLDARWPADALDLRPTVLSILIGVNDIWHTLNGTFHGTVESYETGYSALLARTKQALPGVRLVVLEPFVLRTGVINDSWFPEFDQRRAAAARVAKGAGATFIALQAMFDRLVREAPPSYWSADGVHPTVAGHAAIAREWLRGARL